MGAVFLSKSKKALVFVTNEGVQYVCSSALVGDVVSGRVVRPFVGLALLPTPAAPGRFPVSRVLVPAIPDGQRVGQELTSGNDVYSEAGVRARQQVKAYSSGEVDF